MTKVTVRTDTPIKEIAANGTTALLPETDTALLNEIDSFQELPADWDGEGAAPVARQAISRAKQLLTDARCLASANDLEWKSPSANPNPDGGIDLSWGVEDRKLLLIIHPEREEVVRVLRSGNLQPQRDLQPFEEAASDIVWLLSGR